MTIESTKKIIASIILAIMLLGVTTPTFAATTKSNNFDWGAAIGGFANAAEGLIDFTGRTAKVALPEIENLLTNVKPENENSSSITGMFKNEGTSLFNSESLGNIFNTGLSFLENTTKELPSILSEREQKPEGTEQKNEGNNVINLNIFGNRDNEDGEDKNELGIFSKVTEVIKNPVKTITKTFTDLFNKEEKPGEETGTTRQEGLGIMTELITNEEYREETKKEITEKIKENLGINRILKIFNKEDGADGDKNIGAEDNKIGIENIRAKAAEEKAELQATIENEGSTLKGLLVYFKGNIENKLGITKEEGDGANRELSEVETKIENAKTEASTLFEFIKDEGIIDGIKKYKENKEQIKIEQEAAAEILKGQDIIKAEAAEEEQKKEEDKNKVYEYDMECNEYNEEGKVIEKFGSEMHGVVLDKAVITSSNGVMIAYDNYVIRDTAGIDTVVYRDEIVNENGEPIAVVTYKDSETGMLVQGIINKNKSNQGEERNKFVAIYKQEYNDTDIDVSTLEKDVNAKYEEYSKYSSSDAGNLSKNQCTWWVYCRASDYLGEAYPNKNNSGRYGDAATWDDTAELRKNFETGTEPRANSIGVYEAGEDGMNSKYGHVVYVEEVAGNGSVYISQCNYSGAENGSITELSDMRGEPSTYIYLDRPIE